MHPWQLWDQDMTPLKKTLSSTSRKMSRIDMVKFADKLLINWVCGYDKNIYIYLVLHYNTFVSQVSLSSSHQSYLSAEKMFFVQKHHFFFGATFHYFFECFLIIRCHNLWFHFTISKQNHFLLIIALMHQAVSATFFKIIIQLYSIITSFVFLYPWYVILNSR